MQDAESKAETGQGISAREHFVFTDADGQVYHFTVEGNSVKDGARIPPDVSSEKSRSTLFPQTREPQNRKKQFLTGHCLISERQQE